jgi:hypothetical protein
MLVMRYREAIQAAITDWEGGCWCCFRSKSTESQAAVDALEEVMSDPLDDRLAELVDWLVGAQFQLPASHPFLTPIKQKCKLRDCLNTARRNGDPPYLRMQRRQPRRVESTVLIQPTRPTAAASSSRPASRTAAVTTTSAAATARTPLLSSSAVATPVVVSQPVVLSTPVSAVRRHLMIDCAADAPGKVEFSWSQDNVASFLGIPDDNFFGFCNAATGRFLQDPDTFETYVKGIRGKAVLARAQERYESVGKADRYVTDTYGLTHLSTVGPHTLTPQNVLSCVDKAGGSKMILYLVGAPDGSGHAIGIIKKSTGFLFLDVNEGLTSLGDRNALWRFLYYYITNSVQGLAKEYPQFCMGYWT